MTIASEIQRIQTNVANAYDALENLGATMPATEDTDHLVETIETVSGGDEITLKNLSSSNVTTGQKVWIGENSSYDNDYSIQTSQNQPVINGNEMTSTDSNGLIYKNFAPTVATNKRVFQIRMKASNLNLINAETYARFNTNNWDQNFNGLVMLFFGYFGFNMYWVFNSYSSSSPTLQAFPNNFNSGGLPLNDYFMISLEMTPTTATSYYSLNDGETWTQIETKNINTINNYTNDNYTYNCLACGSTGYITLDLSECFIEKDDQKVWVPTAEVVEPAIINYSDINQNSLTGVAQENIAINSSGIVKTILPE